MASSLPPNCSMAWRSCWSCFSERSWVVRRSMLRLSHQREKKMPATMSRAKPRTAEEYRSGFLKMLFGSGGGTASMGDLAPEDLAIETNHFGEGLIGGFGVEAGAFVAGEGVLGGVEERVEARAGLLEAAVDGFAAGVGDVGIVGAEDHEEFALDLAGAG